MQPPGSSTAQRRRLLEPTTTMQSDLYILQREAEFLSNGETSFRKLIDDLQKQHERESKKSNHVGTATSTEDKDMDEEFAALQQRLTLAKTKKREAQAQRKQLALDAYHRVLLLRSLRERANELSSEHAALLDCEQAIQVENTRVQSPFTDYSGRMTLHLLCYHYVTLHINVSLPTYYYSCTCNLLVPQFCLPSSLNRPISACRSTIFYASLLSAMPSTTHFTSGTLVHLQLSMDFVWAISPLVPSNGLKSMPRWDRPYSLVTRFLAISCIPFHLPYLLA